MAFSFTQSLEADPPTTKYFFIRDDDYESKVITYPMRWMISDYRSLRLKRGCAIKSAPFLLGPKEECQVCLALYPRGDLNSKTDKVTSIYVQYLSGSESWTTGKISFKIVNHDAKETSIGVDTYVPGLGWGIREFCHYDDLDGNTSIFCVLSYVMCNSNTMKKKIEHAVRVSEDFGSLLESSLFSDVSIVIGERELKVHKLVLAARSPVFKAMLESNMSETTTNTINITDIEVRVMQQLLSYIYTGKLNELVDTAEGLLVAADKYCMEELKTECGELLCRNICVDNAARLFLLAEMHREMSLRNKCVEYIKMNMQAVKTTEDWKNLKQTNCKLIVENFVE